MYRNSTAEIRPDIQAVIEEANAADQYFIAQQVLPVKFSKRDTGEYHKLTLTETEKMRSDLGDSTLRAPKSGYKEVDRTYKKDSFTTKDRGLVEKVDDSDRAKTAPSFDAEEVAARLILSNMSRAHEYRVQALFMDAGTFSADAAAVAYTEANISTIDAARDVGNAVGKVKKRGEMVNAIIMAWPVWNIVRRTKLLREYFFGSNGGNAMITRDQFEKAIDENGRIKLYVAEAAYDTAKKGQATSDSTLSYIWPNTYVWVGRIADQGGDVASRERFRMAPVNPDGSAGIITLPAGGVGATIIWEEQADSLFVAETYREENIRSDVLRVRQYSTEKVMNANAGTLITTNFA